VLGNQLDNRGNRGVSDFDRTHRFVLSSVSDIPGSGVCRPFRNWPNAVKQVAIIWNHHRDVGLPIDIVDTAAGSFYGLGGGNL
jgi:hypothetical protein